ncbi:SDR family NAD(P)-dependent oxidoreductase [Streptosporangium lutulentum]
MLHRLRPTSRPGRAGSRPQSRCDRPRRRTGCRPREEGGRHALAMKLDVTDHEQVVSTIGRIMSAFGGIDVLVNNSGVGCFAAAGRSPGDQIRRAGLSAFGLPDEVLLVEPSELHIGRILCPRAETALAEELGRTPTAGTRRAAVRESVGSDGDDPEHAAMAIIKAVDADPLRPGCRSATTPTSSPLSGSANCAGDSDP